MCPMVETSTGSLVTKTYPTGLPRRQPTSHISASAGSRYSIIWWLQFSGPRCDQ